MTHVTVYTKPNCQPCKATKRWLHAFGVPFTEQSLEEEGNLSAAKFLGYQEAPVIVVTKGGTQTHWSGFNPVNLADNLGDFVAEMSK